MSVRLIAFETDRFGERKILGTVDETEARDVVASVLETIVSGQVRAKIEAARLRGMGHVVTSGPEAGPR